MTNNYNWKIIDFKHNKNTIISTYKQIVALKNYPAANQWQYIFPILESEFNREKVSFAILYSYEIPIFILPISTFTVKKFVFKWGEIGYPFHKHINLIKFPDEILEKPSIIEELIHKIKEEYGNKWSRFSIRNIESGMPNLEYCGDASYFKTDYGQNISKIVSKKHIRNLNRIERKFTESFGDYQFTINSPSLPESLDNFIEFEGQSWKGEDGVAISSNSRLRKVYSDICQNFGSKNMFVAKLKSKEQVLSTALGFHMGETLYIHKVSHSHEHSKYSPGSILILKLLEHAINTHAIKNMNLVTSPMWIKRWHPNKNNVGNIVHYNNNLSGRFLNFTIHSWRKYKPSIKSLFNIS